MRTLEEILIQTLGQFGIESQRREGLTGVWVREEKIAALGVRLSRWISMHGFALNVNTDLKFFDGIIPCGIFEYDVTSMSQILGKEVSLVEVEETLITVFRLLFSFQECEEAYA